MRRGGEEKKRKQFLGQMASSAADLQASVLILYCVINHSENDLQEHTEILLSHSPLIHLPQSSITSLKQSPPGSLVGCGLRGGGGRAEGAGGTGVVGVRVQRKCVVLSTSRD